LEGDCEILQIAAASLDGTCKFNVYVKIVGSVPAVVTGVTGLESINGDIFLHGEEVPSVDIISALGEFLQWLSHFEAKVLLVAHNCKAFDSTRMLHHLENAGKVVQFCQYVSGFADTRPMFANLYPELPDVKQSTVVSHVLSETYDAHNAVNDVDVLCRAINSSQSRPHLQAYSFPVQDTRLAVKRHNAMKKWLPSLKCITNTRKEKKAFGDGMAQKIAASGLGLEHLKLAHTRDAEQGILKLFSEQDALGQLRVTKSMKVIGKVQEFLSM
jgi:hypothetical protein